MADDGEGDDEGEPEQPATEGKGESESSEESVDGPTPQQSNVHSKADGGGLRIFRRMGYLRHFLRGEERTREYSGYYYRWTGAQFDQQLLGGYS